MLLSFLSLNKSFLFLPYLKKIAAEILYQELRNYLAQS